MAYISFLDSGSRRGNPYTSRGGGGGRLRIHPKIWLASSAIILIWLVAIVAVVREDPEIKREVLSDIRREENFLRGKLKRGRLRAKEWLRNHLVDADDPSSSESAKAAPLTAQAAKELKHEWDLTQLEDLALRTGPGDVSIHLVFSTDCSPYQHWQAYQFFLAALRTRQPGRVTQIASGCATDEEIKAMEIFHDEHVAPLSLRFGLHLTPRFSSVKDESGKVVGEYEFFNKPFGLMHWMEYGVGMGIDPATQTPWKHDTIIALLDPDQLLVRPITGHFASPGDLFRGGTADMENTDSLLSYAENEPTFTVRHGHPASQEYGFRDSWMKYANVAGAGSPAMAVTKPEALRSYSVGPPYVATALDMYAIAVKWCEFVPKVHKQFPQLLAEMYAFSIATAHLKLPHQLMATMMVSDTAETAPGDGGGEGWPLVDAIPAEEVCSFAMNDLDSDVRPLPNVLHFCHRYGVGDTAFFAKKKLPSDFFSCESPLLQEPAMDIGSGRYLYRKPPFVDKRVDLTATVERREAFMVCALIGFLNEAALFFKNRHCDGAANLDEEISLHDLPE